MADLADAFIAMFGGIGTLDEFFEMVSWTQLGLQRKRCGLLNVCGYYERLVGFSITRWAKASSAPSTGRSFWWMRAPRDCWRKLAIS